MSALGQKRLRVRTRYSSGKCCFLAPQKQLVGRTECARLMTMVPKEALSRGWTLNQRSLHGSSGLPSSSISTTDPAAGLKAPKLHGAPFDVEAARTHESAGPDDLRAAPLGRGCTQCRTHEKSADDGEVEERAGGGRGHERLQLARRDLRHLRCVREAVDADFASRELAETVRGTLRQDLLHRPFSALGAC